MKTKPLHDMNRGQLELIQDSLRWDKLSKKKPAKDMIDMVIKKVKEHGASVELDGMEMKMISRGLMNKAQLMTSVHGLSAKKVEKKMMYDLAYLISSRCIQFQQDNHPLKQKETSTAATVNAS